MQLASAAWWVSVLSVAEQVESDLLLHLTIISWLKLMRFGKKYKYLQMFVKGWDSMSALSLAMLHECQGEGSTCGIIEVVS